MAESAAAGAPRLTVEGISGEVLLGPRSSIHGGETVRELKRKLPDRGGGGWRLLLGVRELLDGEPLASVCDVGEENEMTAIVVKTAGTELARLTADALERTEQLQLESEQWLGACASANEDAKRRRREEDIKAYQQAVATLLQQIEDMSIAESRRAAMDGRSSITVHLENLQSFGLGAKFHFTRPMPIRTDPVLRGWYFCNHGDALDPDDVPEEMVLKRPQFSRETSPSHSKIFINALAIKLVQRFQQQGLWVACGSYWGVLQLSWGKEEDPAEARYQEWFH